MERHLRLYAILLSILMSVFLITVIVYASTDVGDDVTTEGLLTVGTNITTGGALTVGTDLTTEGALTVGTNIVTEGSLTVTGNVGIAVSSPSHHLDVDGDINASGSYRLDYINVLQNPGTENLFFGLYAGNSAGAGATYNTLIGYEAGYSLSTGDSNVFIGNEAGYNSIGSDNIYIGREAGRSSGSGEGSQNLSIGSGAGYGITTGDDNVFLGYEAGYTNTTGEGNVFIGKFAGYDQTTGNNNTFIGYTSGERNVTSTYNTFLGAYAGNKNTGGNNNVFTGYYTGYQNIYGHDNTLVGYMAGRLNEFGNGNVFLGYQAGYSELGSNKLYIDNSDTASPLIHGDFSSDILTVNGNLGIGTTSPAAPLDVYNSATSTVIIDSNTKGSCLKLKDYDGSGYTYCVVNNGEMTCSTNSCE